MTQQVNFRYNLEGSQIDYAKDQGTENFWDGAYFMSFPKEKEISQGTFVPETILEKKLWMANQISKNLREAIYKELGYRASAGISYNKTVAKIASS